MTWLVFWCLESATLAIFVVSLSVRNEGHQYQLGERLLLFIVGSALYFYNHIDRKSEDSLIQLRNEASIIIRTSQGIHRSTDIEISLRRHRKLIADYARYIWFVDSFGFLTIPFSSSADKKSLIRLRDDLDARIGDISTANQKDHHLRKVIKLKLS